MRCSEYATFLLSLFAGAVQCALCCNRCRIGAWQKSHRGMLNHYRAVHDSVCQLPKHADVSGDGNIIIAETCWCIKGLDGDGNAIVDESGSNWTPCHKSTLSFNAHRHFMFAELHEAGAAPRITPAKRSASVAFRAAPELDVQRQREDAVAAFAAAESIVHSTRRS